MSFRICLQTLTKTIGVAVLWLLAAATVDAAPARRHSAPGARCEPRLAFRIDPTPHLQHAKRTPHADDDAAIQNDDPPAAGLGVDEAAVSALRPIGFLAGHVNSRPRTRPFAPRSPRAPPMTV